MVAPQAQRPASVAKPAWATAEEARHATYREARDFLAGVQWEGRAAKGERRMVFNYARALVRKVASYCFPAPVQFIVTDGDTAAQTRAETALAAALDHLDAHSIDIALCIEAATIGDAAVKVTWDKAIGLRLAQVDPDALTARWDPTEPRRLLSMQHDYSLPGYAVQSATGADAAALAPDAFYPVQELWTDASYQISVAGQIVAQAANPYGLIPYAVVANEPQPGSFWGASDLLDLYDPCRELNKRMSVASWILDLSGAPITVLENVDGSEGISAKPGAKWELPEGSKAYLLDLLQSGGMAHHAAYIESLYRTIHDLSETPRTSFGDSGRTLSGAALEVEIQPLVQRVRRKRASFARYYTRRNRLILELLDRFANGVEVGPCRETRAVWPQILPSDDEAHARTEVSLVNAQIHSLKTAASNLGIAEPEAELAQIIAEAKAIAAGAAPAAQENTPHG